MLSAELLGLWRMGVNKKWVDEIPPVPQIRSSLILAETLPTGYKETLQMT